MIAEVTATCASPRPKIWWRMAHRRADRQIQANGEEQKHHAKLGQKCGVFHIADQPQGAGSDQETGRKVAEDGADAEPV